MKPDLRLHKFWTDMGYDYLNNPDFVWLIHKHKETGELLGPVVDGGVPTKVVFALLTDMGWKEIE